MKIEMIRWRNLSRSVLIGFFLHVIMLFYTGFTVYTFYLQIGMRGFYCWFDGTAVRGGAMKSYNTDIVSIKSIRNVVNILLF